jgi:hypothetical protein
MVLWLRVVLQSHGSRCPALRIMVLDRIGRRRLSGSHILRDWNLDVKRLRRGDCILRNRGWWGGLRMVRGLVVRCYHLWGVVRAHRRTLLRNRIVSASLWMRCILLSGTCWCTICLIRGLRRGVGLRRGRVSVMCRRLLRIVIMMRGRRRLGRRVMLLDVSARPILRYLRYL